MTPHTKAQFTAVSIIQYIISSFRKLQSMLKSKKNKHFEDTDQAL